MPTKTGYTLLENDLFENLAALTLTSTDRDLLRELVARLKAVNKLAKFSDGTHGGEALKPIRFTFLSIKWALSKKWFYQSLRRLEEHGFIRVETRGNGQHSLIHWREAWREWQPAEDDPAWVKLQKHREQHNAIRRRRRKKSVVLSTTLSGEIPGVLSTPGNGESVVLSTPGKTKSVVLSTPGDAESVVLSTPQSLPPETIHSGVNTPTPHYGTTSGAAVGDGELKQELKAIKAAVTQALNNNDAQTAGRVLAENIGVLDPSGFGTLFAELRSDKESNKALWRRYKSMYEAYRGGRKLEQPLKWLDDARPFKASAV